MKLWNWHYINILIVTLVVNIASIIIITVLPLYTVSLGGNNVVAGTLMLIFTISALLFRPFFGRLIDERGRRMVLTLGLCFFAVSNLLLIFATNITFVFFLRFLQGIGLSAYSTALGTVISDVVPHERISEGIGYFGIAATISMAVGPPLGLYLSNELGFHQTYLVVFVIALTSGIFAYLNRYERDPNYQHIARQLEHNALEKELNNGKNQKKRFDFIEKSVLRPCFVMLLIVFAISAVFSFMPLYGQARQIENIGLFFSVYATSMIITRLLTGRLADRFGHLVVYLPSVVLTFLLFLILAFAKTLPMVLVAAVFYGVGYGTIQPIMNTIVIKFSPAARRGAANATYYATMDIGFGLGSFVWGGVSQVAGFTAVFLFGAVLIALSLVVYFLILHTQIKARETEATFVVK